MPAGGSRPGAGRKPGIPNRKKRPEKSANLKRIRQQISMPKWIADRLKTEEKNLSRYILRLILRDREWEEPE